MNNKVIYMLSILTLIVISMSTSATNTTVYSIPINITNGTAYVPIQQSVKDKFRIGPTVRIRPLNDVIDISQEGLIEIYMDNPTLNDVVLNVDIRINVPAGLYIIGHEFGDTGSAGTIYSVLAIYPGQSKTVQINIKSDRTGDFFIQLSGSYWPGNNKDAFQPITLAHNFKIYDSNVQKNIEKNESRKETFRLLEIILNKLLELLGNIVEKLIKDLRS